MGIGGPLNELPFSTDLALKLLQEMTVASITGDAEALQQAIQDWALLPVQDKKRIEDIIAMMPYPGLVPMQVSMIFSDPEKFIGAISRLGGPEGAGLANALSGATVSSIVLAAVVSWLQSEQANAQHAHDAAKKEAAEAKATTTETTTKPQEKKAATATTETPDAAVVQKTAGQSPITTDETKAAADVPEGGTTSPIATDMPATSTAQKATSEPVAVMGQTAAPLTATPTTNVAMKETAATPPVSTASVLATGTTAPAADNPINAALLAYIESAGTKNTDAYKQSIDATESLQFLRNNPILLSGLNTVDQSLLLRAYQIAEAQIIIGILDKIIEMQERLRQEQIQRDRRLEAIGNTPQHELLQATRDDIRRGEQPLSQTVLMAMQLLLINAQVMQVGVIQPASSTDTVTPAVSNQLAPPPITMSTPIETAATITNITSAEAGLALAQKLFPHDVVATSILVSIPTFYEGKSEQATSPELLAQLGVLANVYTQMVPYWSIPAAVSFQAQAGGVSEKSITESAVRAFVVAVGTIINDPAFTILIKNTLVRAMPTLTQEQLKTFVAAIKCGLLMNALVALHIMILKKTGGQFSTKDLADMILGKVPLPPDALEEGLIKQLREQLKDIPEEYREVFLYRLLSCYNKDSDLESLIDPAKQFLHLCDQSFFHNAAASESV